MINLQVVKYFFKSNNPVFNTGLLISENIKPSFSGVKIRASAKYNPF